MKGGKIVVKCIDALFNPRIAFCLPTLALRRGRKEVEWNLT